MKPLDKALNTVGSKNQNWKKQPAPKLPRTRTMKRIIFSAQGREVACIIRPLTRQEQIACDMATD